MLTPSLRRRLQIIQQCRPDDIERVRARYAELGIPAELMTYIEDMPDKLAEAHLVIGRAGASTHRRADRGGAPRDPDSLAVGDRRSPDRQCPRDGPGRRGADDPADRSSRPTCWRGRSRRWRPTRRRWPMPRRGRCRSGGRMPRATSPIWSSGSAAGLAPVMVGPVADPARRSRRSPAGVPGVKALGYRHRHDPLRRHRRHRHVRHRRGDAPIGLQGAGLGHRRRLCRRRPAQGRHPGDDRA